MKTGLTKKQKVTEVYYNANVNVNEYLSQVLANI